MLERPKNLQVQLDLMQRKRESLIVRSPTSGQVLLPWDAEQSLLRRPVVHGQRVMTIAKAESGRCRTWEIELAMPERRMGHVPRAMEKFDSRPLEVSYVTAADAREPKKGTLTKGLSDHAGQGRGRSHGQDDRRHQSGGPVRTEPGHDGDRQGEMWSLLARLLLVPRSD